jgi:membrane protein
MVVRSFNQNRCPVRASALAYASLLALIPLLAVVVSVTSTFLKQEGEERIDQFIEQVVASVTPPALMTTNLVAATTNVSVTVTNVALTDQPSAEEPTADSTPTRTQDETKGQTNVVEVLRTAATTNATVKPAFLRHQEVVDARKTAAHNINQFIQNTRSGALGVTGSVLLIFAAISMLSRVEMTFNDIWGVTRGRSWFMRVILYWGVITLAPLLLVLGIALATGPHLERTRELLYFSPFLANLLFRILPVIVLSLTFAAFYKMMPNTRVHWQAALAGGLTAGLLFHLNNVFSMLYVSRVVSSSKIYGSLGLVPVFMIGLYFCWLLLLFGGQVAYAWQNRESYLEQRQADNINQRGKEFIAMRLMTAIGNRFAHGETPPSVSDLSEQLCVPSRLVRQVLQTLVAARLLIEVVGPETGYAPARPLQDITCHDVLLALRAAPGRELATRDEPARHEVYGEFARIQEAERNAASGVNLLALVNRAELSETRALAGATAGADIARPAENKV